MARFGTGALRSFVCRKRTDARARRCASAEGLTATMVDVMLETTCKKSIAFDFPSLAIEIVEAHTRPWLAFDRHCDTRTGKATFIFDLGIA